MWKRDDSIWDKIRKKGQEKSEQYVQVAKGKDYGTQMKTGGETEKHPRIRATGNQLDA